MERLSPRCKKTYIHSGIKILIFSLLVCMPLASCDDSISRGRTAYMNYLNETLKDPESLKIYKEVVLWSNDASAHFELDYGARNSFGGYVRTTEYFYTIGHQVFRHGKSMGEVFGSSTKAPSTKQVVPDKYSEYKKEGFFTRIKKSSIITQLDTLKVGKEVVLSHKNLVAKCTSGDNYYTKIERAANGQYLHEFNEACNNGNIFPLDGGTNLIIKDIKKNYYVAEVLAGYHKGKTVALSLFFK